MKRTTLWLLLLALCAALPACKSVGNTSRAEMDYGHSDSFQEAEVRSAFDAVLIKFRDFKGCILKKLWYDESAYVSRVENYLSNGRGSVNGVKRENVIILFSDFYVDSSGGDGSFTPKTAYTNWSWILIREGADDKWQVDDWGY